MADDNFRSNRSRDVPQSTGAPARGQGDDPLAELARLIGQNEPAHDFGRDMRRDPGPSFVEPVGDLDWAARDSYADDRFAEPNQPAEENFALRSGEHYEQSRRDDVPPSYRPGPSTEVSAPRSSQFSAPAPSFNGARGYARDTALTREPPQSRGRELPAFLPRLPAEDYADDEEPQAGADDDGYALEDYEEEAPAGRRRSGLVVVAAVLGLAVLGTAGAFAYRAMFGSSMLPTLPPIIKADDGPTKIVPSKPKSNGSDQADANANSGEKLVPREEQPVDMPAPANPAPRVVSTIPIFPDPNSGQAGVPNSAQAATLGAGGTAAPAPATPPPAQANVMPSSPAASIWPPGQTAAPAPAAGATSGAPAATSPAPKKVHTVIIRSDQMGATTADALPAAAPMPQPAAAAPVSAPVRTMPARTAMQPPPRPAPRAEANAPLSIVPDQGGAAPAAAPAHARTAPARPAELSSTERAEAAAPPSAGGYAVQVTSQRSEAEAQAEFRTLRAKFPTQLGGRAPIVRRADLGDKGVYYRALVGPFASMDQAAAMCSSLRAAGGSCIVQHD
jgi:SPOR domain